MRKLVAPVLLTALLAVATTAKADEDAALWPDVSARATVKVEGANDAAVVVAIEDYEKLPKVPGAAKNGQDWVTFLQKSRGIPFDRIQRVLTNDVATLEEVKPRLEEAAKQAQEGGTLWFVFVGHGSPAMGPDNRPATDDGLLVLADANANPRSIQGRSLKRSDLIAIMAKSAASKKVAILDACFSGLSGPKEQLAKDTQPTPPVLSFAALPSGFVTLTAGASSEYSGPLPGAERPAFSYLVLGALRGWADTKRTGQVSAGDAVKFARSVLGTVPLGRTQQPEMAGEDVILSREAREPAPDVEQIARTLEKKKKEEIETVTLGRGRGWVATFLPRVDGEPWSLVDSTNRRVCKLPCEKAIGEESGLALRYDAPTESGVWSLPVPGSFAYSPGEKVDVRPKAGGGSWAVPVVGATAGVLGLIGGGVSSIVLGVGCQSGGPCTRQGATTDDVARQVDWNNSVVPALVGTLVGSAALAAVGWTLFGVWPRPYSPALDISRGSSR